MNVQRKACKAKTGTRSNSYWTLINSTTLLTGFPFSALERGVDDVLEFAAAFALVFATAVREHPRCQSGRGQRRAYDLRRQENVRVVRHGRHGARRGRPRHRAG